MSDTKKQDRPETPDREAPPDEGAAGGGEPGSEQGAMTPEQAEELVVLARSGDIDVPVGAEDFIEALRLVAAQRDANQNRLHRTMADYQNFQRRARQNERETRELTAAGVVQSLIQVLDFFDMALKQDPATATAEQVIGGVEMIKSEFIRILTTHGVGSIVPTGGDEFDPTRHEAVERTTETETPPGHVVEVRSPGYTMGERVIRPAKVVVSAEAARAGETACEEG